MRFSSISSGRSFYAPSFFVGFCLGGSGLDWVEDYYMVVFFLARAASLGPSSTRSVPLPDMRTLTKRLVRDAETMDATSGARAS